VLFLGHQVRDIVERRDIFRFLATVGTRIPELGGDYAGVEHLATVFFEMAIEERVEQAEREPSDFPLLDPEVIARDRPDISPG
jgi:hypothetical protein